MSLNQTIRRYVPSVSMLTYRSWFRWLSRLADFLPKVVWREFRSLPPNELRARVGVGNRIFTNQVMHIRQGYDFWLHAAGLFRRPADQTRRVQPEVQQDLSARLHRQQ